MLVDLKCYPQVLLEFTNFPIENLTLSLENISLEMQNVYIPYAEISGR